MRTVLGLKRRREGDGEGEGTHLISSEAPLKAQKRCYLTHILLQSIWLIDARKIAPELRHDLSPSLSLPLLPSPSPPFSLSLSLCLKKRDPSQIPNSSRVSSSSSFQSESCKWRNRRMKERRRARKGRFFQRNGRFMYRVQRPT